MAARPSATAALLLLLVLSLLAVAHCRTVAVAADHDTEPEPTAAVAVNDEKQVATDEEALPLPAEQHHDFEFLRLPSHRIHHHRYHHRPCSLHRHLWWKRHHGHGERREAVSRLAMILPAEEEARETEEVKPVAEPDPDRSLPDSDGEGQLVASREEPSSFADADGHDGEGAAAVRAWKKEMVRRWFQFHFHHGLRRHRLHHGEEVSQEQQEKEAAPEDMNMKRFHVHHHHRDEEDEEKNMVGKRLRHAEHDHDEESDDEDEDVEEMVRLFRKAIMRRRFGHGHGRRFFHHFHHDHSHHHRHAEEAEKPQAAGGDDQGGVMDWIKGLMNRF